MANSGGPVDRMLCHGSVARGTSEPVSLEGFHQFHRLCEDHVCAELPSKVARHLLDSIRSTVASTD